MYWKPDAETQHNLDHLRLRAGFTKEQILEIERKGHGRNATREDVIAEARISGSPMHLVYARISRLEEERKMETFDKVRDRSAVNVDPLGPLFASVGKLEEERSSPKMSDTINPPATQTTTSNYPDKVPATLDTATPIVPVTDDGRPKPLPPSANSGNFPGPAQPEGNVDLVVQAANAAAVPKTQMPPSVVAGEAIKGKGPTVTMVFPHRVLLTISHELQIEFLPGTREVPEEYANHSYLASNKVTRYDPHATTGGPGFPATMPSGESKFCPNCGKPNAAHIGALRVCPA
jgi:hypothetical protein